MELNNPLSSALFSTPIGIVLDFLLQHPDAEMSDTEIASELRDVKKSAVNMALRKTAEVGLTLRTYRGRMALNRLKPSPLTDHLKIVSNLALIQPLARSLSPHSSRIVLFGSRSDGSHTAESDFDLLVVTSDEAVVKRLIRRDAIAEKIQALIKGPAEMLTLTKDAPVLAEQIRKGIVLWQKE